MSNALHTTPDFATIRRIARGMAIESLLWSAQDAHEAALMAESLEAAGCRVQKTGGYYRDEASVYRTEIRRRQQDPSLDQDGKCPCCKK